MTGSDRLVRDLADLGCATSVDDWSGCRYCMTTRRASDNEQRHTDGCPWPRIADLAAGPSVTPGGIQVHITGGQGPPPDDGGFAAGTRRGYEEGYADGRRRRFG